MIGGWAVLSYCGTMLCGGVAFVAAPVVLWVLLGKALHIVVAVGLCKNRGGGYAHIGGIALYNCGVCYPGVGVEFIAVD